MTTVQIAGIAFGGMAFILALNHGDSLRQHNPKLARKVGTIALTFLFIVHVAVGLMLTLGV